MTEIQRCPVRHPGMGAQCGLAVDHDGEHTVLIPSNLPWATHRVRQDAPAPNAPTARERDGLAVHDHGIVDPGGCPRQRTDCAPLARYASPAFESFMCCGETSTAPVPTDRLRLCIKSTHDHGVDVLVNLDERDAVHTSSVLLAGLSALGSVRVEAHNA